MYFHFCDSFKKQFCIPILVERGCETVFRFCFLLINITVSYSYETFQHKFYTSTKKQCKKIFFWRTVHTSKYYFMLYSHEILYTLYLIYLYIPINITSNTPNIPLNFIQNIFASKCTMSNTSFSIK